MFDFGLCELTLLRIARAEKGSITRVASGHLLQDGDEEPNLDLSTGLQKTVKSGGPFCFGKNAEPLLDGTKFLFEVLNRPVRLGSQNSVIVKHT